MLFNSQVQTCVFKLACTQCYHTQVEWLHSRVEHSWQTYELLATHVSLLPCLWPVLEFHSEYSQWLYMSNCPTAKVNKGIRVICKIQKKNEKPCSSAWHSTSWAGKSGPVSRGTRLALLYTFSSGARGVEGERVVDVIWRDEHTWEGEVVWESLALNLLP